jgi:tRNA nucleotidyltransferase (CCA-adding enzyme)
VRILRLARFAARFFPLGFTIARETEALMREMVASGEIEHLVPERVWKEMSRSLEEKDPSQFIEVLRSCGALEVLWPELNKLWGVPQPAEHHPEIDVGVHVMMVLRMACALSTDPVTRFAALCHDLGKGSTPPEHWPKHRGHEELGVPLIQAFCNRYKLPTEYKALAVLVSRYHLHCHRAFELNHNTLLNTLERLDAFRKPERFEKFLLACEADARGRLGLENKPYPQANKMRAAFRAAKNVDIRSLIEQGFTGETVKQKIHQLRVGAIKQTDTDPKE